MKRMGYLAVGCFAALAFAAVAHATPNPNSAKLNLRVFNDCVFSTVNTTNGYPGVISIDDDAPCASGANLHTWQFSDDGGATNATFENNSAFEYSSDFFMDGNGQGEGGMIITPWWSNSDGRLNIKTEGHPSGPGEIACFGGRLPFFSFTGAFGLLYHKGLTVHIDITYLPHSLSAADPATIEYKLNYPAGGPLYDSGPLPFDEGNAAEGHGTWGMLNKQGTSGTPAPNGNTVGGHVQVLMGFGGRLHAKWNGIVFTNLDAVPTNHTTWGRIQTLYR